MTRARMSAGKRTTLWALAALSLFYLLAPPGWMLVSSFSPVTELYSRPPHWIPHRPTLEHYATLFQTAGANAAALSQNPQVRAFPRSFANSLIIALATTVICVMFGSVSAYTLSRFVGRERQKLVLLGLLATRMIPVVSILIPIYFALQRLGLLDTLSGLILVYSGLLLPFVIWILEGYYRDFPHELEEAASIDGAGKLAFFFRMVLPLSLPGVITTGILAFVASWNQYLLPLFILNDEAAFTLPLGVQQFSSQYSEDTAKVLAFTSLSMIPALIFFSLFERRIVGGLQGAVKG